MFVSIVFNELNIQKQSSVNKKEKTKFSGRLAKINGPMSSYKSSGEFL